MISSISRSLGCLLGTAALAACGGSDSGSAPPATYTVGGTVTALKGSGLVLQSGGVNLAVSESGAFTFGARLTGGSAYLVVVQTQPSSPPQLCTVANDAGTVASGNITNVSVTCADEYTVGGNVSGLVGSGLILQIYDHFDQDYVGSPLNLLANGPFTFDTLYQANGSDYEFVRIKQQPSSPTQLCIEQNAAINITTSNITDVAVLCSEFSYIANSGDNTVSAYTVDATSGALAAVGSPAATGVSPKAIAGTPDKKYVFVGNAGSNDISAFAVDPATGGLTEISGSPFAAGSKPGALALIGTSTGYYLYVADTGSNNLSAFAVNPSTGALTPLSTATFATGKAPSAIAVDPSGSFIYVANHGGSNDISAFTVDSGTGILTEITGSPFAAGSNPFSLSFGASGKFLYAANPGGTTPSVSGFTVNASSGVLTALAGSPFSLPVINSIAADRTGEYLYLTTDLGIAPYSIDPKTGLLNELDYPFAAGLNPYGVAIDPTNQFLYVTNEGGDSISGFKLDPSSGDLLALPGSPFNTGHTPEPVTTL